MPARTRGAYFVVVGGGRVQPLEKHRLRTSKAWKRRHEAAHQTERVADARRRQGAAGGDDIADLSRVQRPSLQRLWRQHSNFKHLGRLAGGGALHAVAPAHLAVNDVHNADGTTEIVPRRVEEQRAKRRSRLPRRRGYPLQQRF